LFSDKFDHDVGLSDARSEKTDPSFSVNALFQDIGNFCKSGETKSISFDPGSRSQYAADCPPTIMQDKPDFLEDGRKND